MLARRFPEFKVARDRRNDCCEDAQTRRARDDVLLDIGVPLRQKLKTAAQTAEHDDGQIETCRQFFVRGVGFSV